MNRLIKNKYKNQKGITLIALVIMIIIIIIITGVIINLSLGNSGIFNKANEAKFKTQMSKYREEVDLYVLDIIIDKLSDEAVKINSGDILKQIVEQGQITDIKAEEVNLKIEKIIKDIKNSEKDYIVVYKGNMYYVSDESNKNNEKYKKWCKEIGIPVLEFSKPTGMDVRNGNYELVNDMYICTPNLAQGFKGENTRYLNENEAR